MKDHRHLRVAMIKDVGLVGIKIFQLISKCHSYTIQSLWIDQPVMVTGKLVPPDGPTVLPILVELGLQVNSGKRK